jgi:transposase
MEEVLDLYQQPYDPAYPQLCIDEKSVQLLSDLEEPLPPMPGHVAKEDCRYARHGTANIFCVFEPLAAWRQLTVTCQRKREDFAHLIQQLLEGRYASARKLILVVDNLNTHSPASLYETFGPEQARALTRRLEFHYTPKHGSWLNMAEIELSVLGKRLKSRVAEAGDLGRVCAALEQDRNERKAGIEWRFTTADARIKLARLYPS